MPRCRHILGADAGGLAKCHQVGLVAHDEVGQARKETGVVDGLAQHIRLEPAQRQKPRKHIRLTCQPAKYGDGCFMTVSRRSAAIFCVVQHLFTGVTYFSTKSH